jgi:hypothetical protein
LFIRDYRPLRKYNIIFVVLAVSILVLGWELYDTRQELNNLNSTLKHSITLRTFNFTIVLRHYVESPNFGDVVVDGGGIENVTLVPTDDIASTLSLSELLAGSRALNVSDLGLFRGNYVLVNTYGYDFYDTLIKTTGPVTYEDQNWTITVTYYTFTGQVDLLYPTLAGNATFYLASQPRQPFNLTATSKALYKVVSLP